MPLPWNKAKTGRISRLVTDLRSSNRGDSLVVQTGFPTSLIDLFVKNRDRLKKRSKKKRRNLSEEVSDPAPSSLDSCSISKSSANPSLVSASEINYVESENCEGVRPLVVEKVSFVSGKVEDVVEVSVQSGGFMKVVTLFLLLILALVTKKFAIGLTVSAFSLLFLEFAGKRVFYFLKPCEKAQRILTSVVERGLSRNETDGFDQILTAKELTGHEEAVVTNAFGSSEINLARIEEIQIIEPDFELLDCERRLELTESDLKRSLGKDENLVDVTDFSNRRTKTGKIRAMLLTKFVRKKRHGSKSGRNSENQGQDLRGEILSSFIEKKVTTEEQKNDNEQGKSEDEETEEEEEEVAPVPSSAEVSQVKLGTDVAFENMDRKTEGGSGCLTVILIVLAGLVGGRIMGLLLITGWCLLATVRRISKVTDRVSSLRINFKKALARRSFYYS